VTWHSEVVHPRFERYCLMGCDAAVQACAS